MQSQTGKRVPKKAAPRVRTINFCGTHEERQCLIKEANRNAAELKPGRTVSSLIYYLLREEYPLTFKQIVGKWRAKVRR